MKSFVLITCLLITGVINSYAQDSATNRSLSLAEYDKAKNFTVNDLDKDTYVKFENTYILDRNGFGKPYFITGDDGMKKRIDLYKLILKEGRLDLGTIIFYTTETGKRYTACMPAYNADASLWKKYFEDIHAIDKEEKFYVLKLSYVLSKELGFQLYRAASGKDVSKEREAGTYGNDICFPGDMQVAMAGGAKKSLSEIKAGDEVLTVDPSTHINTTVKVKELTVHEEKNYALTKLLLIASSEKETNNYKEVMLFSKTVQATPNHPMVTLNGNKKMSEVKEGDKVLCVDEKTNQYKTYTVFNKEESAGGIQHVYNIIAESGTTFIMNDVMVLQKPLRN
jgi:hypothetical protein